MQVVVGVVHSAIGLCRHGVGCLSSVQDITVLSAYLGAEEGGTLVPSATQGGIPEAHTGSGMVDID